MKRNKLKKRGLKQFRSFVIKNFKESKEYIKEIKNFIWFSSILFLIISLIGFFFPIFFEKEILDLIKNILLETEGMQGIELIRFIMFNNIKSAFSGMIFGVLFGIVPLLILIMNSYILGFVASKTVASDGLLILWKLLPHGILEIPAILISISLGLKLGMFIFSSRTTNKKIEFLNELINSVRVFIFNN